MEHVLQGQRREGGAGDDTLCFGVVGEHRLGGQSIHTSFMGFAMGLPPSGRGRDVARQFPEIRESFQNLHFRGISCQSQRWCSF